VRASERVESDETPNSPIAHSKAKTTHYSVLKSQLKTPWPEKEAMIWKKMAHLAEIHTLHTLTSERRTDRRRRRSLTRTDYEFDDLVFGYRFLRHCVCVEGNWNGGAPMRVSEVLLRRKSSGTKRSGEMMLRAHLQCKCTMCEITARDV
jgi:hypothetical protein